MGRKRAWTLMSIAAAILAAALLVTSLSVAGGDSPSARPDKLDAVLAGLLPSPAQGAQPSGQDSSNDSGYGEPVKWDGFTPLHTDVSGRTYVDVLVQTDGSVKGLEELGVSVGGRLGSVVAARVPLESLGPLTALGNVRGRPSRRPSRATRSWCPRASTP